MMEFLWFGIMDSIRINERAWGLILDRIQDMQESGTSQAAIARLIGCDRATVNRWVLDRRGGERTSFKNMIRILDRLRIPLKDVFDTGEDLPAPSPDHGSTDMDKAVATILANVAEAVGKNAASIAVAVKALDEPDVTALLKGRHPMRVSDFISICKAVGVAPGVILERAADLSGE